MRTKIWLEARGRFVIGEGGMHLLRSIARLGSLAEAARRIGWSYRHAWGYLRDAETAIGAPLTRPRSGKGKARGTQVTPQGRRLLRLLGDTRARIDRVAGRTGLTPSEVSRRGRRARAPAATIARPAAPTRGTP